MDYCIGNYNRCQKTETGHMKLKVAISERPGALLAMDLAKSLIRSFPIPNTYIY